MAPIRQCHDDKIPAAGGVKRHKLKPLGIKAMARIGYRHMGYLPVNR